MCESLQVSLKQDGATDALALRELRINQEANVFKIVLPSSGKRSLRGV